MDSLAPVIELLHTHRAHEDFSERYSWIKEDFERQFYSKRAALKVELIETLDDAPVWASTDNEGYGNALFRDVMAWLDRKERKLLLALRMGRTASEIATVDGLAGHVAPNCALETKIDTYSGCVSDRLNDQRVWRGR